MRKKGRVKRGSALIMVLALAMFFSIIAGISITAVSLTFRASSGEKQYEDLLYAAESGIDMAYAHFNNKKNISKSSKYIFPPENTSDFNGYNGIDRVEVEAVPVNDKIMVTSTAYSKAGSKNKRVSKAILKKNKVTLLNKGNIFEHSLVAGNGNIFMEGPGYVDIGDSKISSFLEENLQGVTMVCTTLAHEECIIGKICKGYVVARNGYEELIPIDSFKKADEVTLNLAHNIEASTFEINNNKISVSDSSHVLSETTTSVTGKFDSVVNLSQPVPANFPWKVFIVNADKLRIKVKDGSSLDRTIIIGTGDIVVEPANQSNGVSQGSVNMTFSTIYGKNINIRPGASLNTDFAPEQNSTGTEYIGAFIPENLIQTLDKRIRLLIPNWNTEKKSLDGPEYEFEEGSFEYN